MRLIAWLLGVIGLSLFVAFVLGGAELAPASLLMALPFVSWFLVRRRLNPAYASPVSIVLFVFASIAALGYSLRHELAKETAGVSIIIDLPEDVAWRTLILISVSASIMVLSAGVCLSLFRGGRARPTAITWQARPANIWVLLASAVPLAMFLSDVPLADFFERSYYLVGARGGIVASLGAQLAVVAVVVLGYVAATGSLGLKLGSYPLLACYVMLMLSFGSRRFALLPVLFALGFFLARNTAGTRRGLLLGGVLSLLLLPLPLEFRSNSMHGIIPYVATLSHLDWEDIDWFGAVNNVLVSFPIIGESAYGGHPVYLSDLLVALNPLPGDAAGFYDSYQRLRLNFFTPMAGIGELGAIGWTAVAPFFAGLGAALAWIELSVRRQLVGGSLIYGGLLIALTALFSLQMVQYNLRSAVRLLFYAIVIEIVRRMLAVVVRKRQGSAVPRGGRVRPVADRA